MARPTHILDTYIEHDGVRNRKYAVCLCSCGKQYDCRFEHLSKSKGCGCYKSDLAKINNRLRANNTDGQIVSAYKRLYGTYRHTCAGKRGYSWELDFDQFMDIVTKPCYYCGKEPSQVTTYYRTGATALYNGIDRKNNDLGYTLDNCAPCCKHCNRIKLDTPYDEFLEWIRRVYHHVFQDSV